jgi:hypothetical protein
MTSLVTLAVLCLFPAGGAGLQRVVLAAQAGDHHAEHVIEGVVKDSAGVLPGAEVRLAELDRVVVTDADGRFRFVGVPAGRLTRRPRDPASSCWSPSPCGRA